MRTSASGGEKASGAFWHEFTGVHLNVAGRKAELRLPHDPEDCGEALDVAVRLVMPTLTREDTTIYYEEHGRGFPVLLLAPGGMRSSIAWWDRAPFHPVRELAGEHRLIAMDQRNAGHSRAPVRASDGWAAYVEDQVALLDHMGIERCHLLGGCIGAAFALRLIAMAPARVCAAVLQQPIGLSEDNRSAFHALFDSWAEELAPGRPDVTSSALGAVKTNLYGGDFVFSVSRSDVQRCRVPLLVLRGNDSYHPSETSEEIARIAPHAELIPSWKEGDDRLRAVARIRTFFADHTPRGTADLR
jgi:pimeloyl-ACP methyl ester carboxylesterase